MRRRISDEMARQFYEARRDGQIRPLVGLLDPTVNEGLVMMSLSALAEIRDPSVLETILDYLERDKRAGVQQAGCRALGHLGDPRAIPSLEAALADPKHAGRHGAADALGDIGGADAANALMPGLHAAGDPILRRKTLLALGRCDCEEAAAALRDVVSRGGWSMSRRAAKVLRHRGLRVH